MVHHIQPALLLELGQSQASGSNDVILQWVESEVRCLLESCDRGCTAAIAQRQQHARLYPPPTRPVMSQEDKSKLRAEVMSMGPTVIRILAKAVSLVEKLAMAGVSSGGMRA